MGFLTNAARGVFAKLGAGKVAVTASNIAPVVTGTLTPVVGFSAPVQRTGAPGLAHVSSGATHSNGHPSY